MRSLIVCPGRGTYQEKDWGKIKAKAQKLSNGENLLRQFDDYRLNLGIPSLSELDTSIPYTPHTHLKGEHAADLIFANSYFDYLHFKSTSNSEIVGVVGNSMGHYIALVVAEVLTPIQGLHLIHTMGSMCGLDQSQAPLMGTQMVYPFMNDLWKFSDTCFENQRQLIQLARECGVFVSIYYGGHLVFGGHIDNIHQLKSKLPPKGIYPLVLSHHSAFHTPLLQWVSDEAKTIIDPKLFKDTSIPLVDGRGMIWYPGEFNPFELWDYTLTHQVLQTYDFTTALNVASCELAPSQWVLTGPGTTLGGAVGQALIQMKWVGMEDKGSFTQNAPRYLLQLPIS